MNPGCRFICFSVLILVVMTRTSWADEPSAGDGHFAENRWRQALSEYQKDVRSIHGQSSKGKKAESEYYSILNETDFQNILKSHALFERGVISFLRKNYSEASRCWVDARDTLGATPAAGAAYLRRLNMALANLWILSLKEKDAAYCLEGLTAISKVIEDAPLPADCRDFYYQLQNEYRFVSARDILAAAEALSHRSANIDEIESVTSKVAQTIWMRKRLINLIADSANNSSRVHEALTDRMLFKLGDKEISKPLLEKILNLTRDTPKHARSVTVALLCLYATDTISPDDGVDLMHELVDFSQLGKVEFGHAMSALVKVGDQTVSANVKPLMEISARQVKQMQWKDSQARQEMATKLARNGYPKEALVLLKSELPSLSDREWGAFTLALVEVLYLCGDIEGADQELASLMKKTDAGLIAHQALYWNARLLAKKGDVDGGIEALKQFLAASPRAAEAPEAAFFLGTLQITQGKQREAMETFQMTVMNYPGSPYAEKSRGFLSGK